MRGSRALILTFSQDGRREKRGWIPACAGMTKWGVGMTKWVLGRRGKMDSRLRGNDEWVLGGRKKGDARPFDRLRVSGGGKGEGGGGRDKNERIEGCIIRRWKR